MTLQQETLDHAASSDVPPTGAGSAPAVLTKRERMMVDRLAGSGGALARALTPLNVMGGIAECAGALLLHATLGETVSVAVRRGAPGQLSVVWVDAEGADGTPSFTTSLDDLRTTQGHYLPAHEMVERFRKKLNAPGLSLLGALVEGCRSGLLTDQGKGWSIGGVMPAGLITTSATIAPLTLAALGAGMAIDGAHLDRAAAVPVVQRVQQDWLGWPLGLGHAHAVVSSEAGTLHQFRSDALSSAGKLELPPPLELLGIDCGAEAADARLVNQRVRAAAAIGRVLVGRIMEHEAGGRGTWKGHLSGLSMSDFVERFRDRLPTKMKGREFLDRFGDPGDTLAPIEPAYVYKVRSRTEHMIYEHARATHFAELISRGTRKSEPQAFADAGKLMYASHWSYSQRCGMGAVETDFLVNQLRGCGVGKDIYGAKACGPGCGGQVAVFMRSTPVADQALAAVCAAYQQKTRQMPRVLRQATGPALDLGPISI